MLRPSSLIALVVLCLFASVSRGQSSHVKITTTPDWVVARQSVDYEARTPEKTQSGTYYLLVDSQSQVEKQATYVHRAYRVTSSAGVQHSSQFEVTFDPDYEWVDFHELKIWREGKTEDRLNLEKMQIMRNEREVDRYQYNGQLTALFILDDIRVGDVIEFSYTSRGRNPIFGDHFGRFELANLTSPIHREMIRISTSVTHPLIQRQIGKALLTYSSSHDDDLTVHEWQAMDLPAVRYEEGAPSWYLPFSILQVSDFANWREIVDWALPLYSPKPISPSLRDKVKELTKDAVTSNDRVVAILDFVQRDIRYLGVELGPHSHAPNEPDKVFQTRYGDCKDKVQLFCAMLKEAGIEAVPALVQSSMGKATKEWLPSIYDFDHVIAKVHLPGGDRWLDPTLTNQAGTIEYRALPDYGWALPIEAGSTKLEWVRKPIAHKDAKVDQLSRAFASTSISDGASDVRHLKARIPTLAISPDGSTELSTAPGANDPVESTATTGSEVFIKETYTLGKPGDPAELEVVSTYHGLAADALRGYLRDAPVEDVAKNALNFRTKNIPGIQKGADPTWEDHRKINEIIVTYHYRMPELWQKEKDSPLLVAQFYPYSFSERLEAPAGTVRSTPYAIPYPFRTVHQFVIQCDRPWPTKDSSVTYWDLAFKGKSNVTRVGRNILIIYEFTTLADSVDAERMVEYTANLRKFHDALGYSLSFNTEVAKRDAVFRVNVPLIVVASLTLVLASLLAWWCYYLPWGLHSPRLVPPSPELQGLGGWLVLVGIGVFLRPLYSLGMIISSITKFIDARYWEKLIPKSHALILGEVAAQEILFVLMIFCAVAYLRRRRIFPLALFGCFLSTLVYQIADLVLASQILDLKPENALPQLQNLFQVVMLIAIWGPYLFVSARVKATFTHEARTNAKAIPPALTIAVS